MPNERLSAVKIVDVLRLKFEAGLSNRQIARSLHISHTTVAEYLRRAEAAGISWPLPESLSPMDLERQLFRQPQRTVGNKAALRVTPDWAEVHQQLKSRKGVTLSLLWQEYQERHGQAAYQYSQFTHHYRQWLGSIEVVMRQHHVAGEKMFVDYTGELGEVIDPHSGERRAVEIFVAVLGASHYTYAEASWSQSGEDWIGSHIRAFEFFGGCPKVLVPDNLKAAVNRAHRYEPDLNRSYAEMAAYYGVAIVPARVRKPRDKSLVENGVQRVEQWVLARLRHLQCFSLPELNRHIWQLLDALNDRPFQKLPGSRRSQFLALERGALQPLPAQRFVYGQWSYARVAPNVHIKADQCFYSVPYALVGKRVEVRLSASLVEVFHQHQRVACHQRSHRPGHYETVAAHLPESHRQYLEWTPQRLLAWAEQHGPQTQAFIQALLESRPYPQQAFNACLGAMRLAKSVGHERMEAACRRALHFGAISYKSLESILKHGLDHQALPGEAQPSPKPLPDHANVRGPRYYH